MAGAVLVYYPSLDQWFFTDDFIWLEAASNPDLPEFFEGSFTFPRGPTPYWRPLIDFYFFGMYRVFHLEAGAYHTANLLIHGAIAAMTVVMMQRVTRSLAVGVCAGTLFAIAPTYWTGVVWVSSATTLIAVFLSLLSLLLFLWHLEHPKAWLLAASAVTFAGALLAKETSVVVPGMMALLGFLVLKKPTDARRLIVGLVPLALLDAAYMGLQLTQVYVERPSDAYQIGWHILPNLFDRLLWLSLPLQDTLPLRGSYDVWVGPAQGAALATFAAAAILSAARRRWVLPVLFLTTVVLLLPSSLFTRPLNPRWVYFASIPWAGFITVLALLAVQNLSKRHAPAGAGLAAIMVVIFVMYLVPMTTQGRDSIDAHSAEMREIGQVLQTDCTNLGRTKNLYLFQAIASDPGYAVPAMTRLFYPGTAVLRVEPPMPVPREGDCLLSYQPSPPTFVATDGGDYAAGPYWSRDATQCQGAVSWEDAYLHVGRVAVVRGPLMAVHQLPEAGQTRLDLGESGAFSVTVQAHGYDRYPSLASDAKGYIGSTVCAAGLVNNFGGVPLIVAERPSALAILDSPHP